MENSNTGLAALKHAGKLTVIGSAFVGVGALLNAYVPAFHAPVRWTEQILHRSGQALSSNPLFSPAFRDNPLTNSKTMKEFLAVNIVESAMIGGLLIVGGVGMKYTGVTTRDVEQWLGTRFGHRP